MRIINLLQVALVALLGLTVIAHAQQCVLMVNTTQIHMNITTNAQFVNVHAWGVLGIRNTTTCNLHYIAFGYSLPGMETLLYINAVSNTSDYIVINYTNKAGYALTCLALNPLSYRNGVVYITSSSGRVTAYCSLVDKGSLTLYGVLIVVLVSIALASSSYFLIRSLIDVPRARF
jgi:hypothetical protein